MSLISIEFAIFLFIALALNWALLPFKRLYRLFLLSACYIFYGALSLKFLALLINFSVWTFLLGGGIAVCSGIRLRKSLLVLHLLIGIGGLIFFKYYDLLYESMGQLAVYVGSAPFLPEIDIAVPVGISFFTFQGLSYSIDVFRDAGHRVKSPLDLFIFIAFFPTILCGPIMRASDFVPQIGNMRQDRKSSGEAFCLILSGLAKKLVVASYLSKHVVQPVFEDYGSYSSFCVALGVLGYSVQILCDFSGYTDMVRGIALLLGYTTPVNFNYPYSARNLREFWSRWHMSLSFWLRDYLYIPLGGNRRGKIRAHLNILITMLVGGLWHGPSWTFLLWGGFHGIGISATHLFRDVRKKIRGRIDEGSGPCNPVMDALCRLFTFVFVSVGWIFFRSGSIGQATGLLHRIIELDPTAKSFPHFVTPVTVCLIATVLFIQAFRVKLVEVTGRLLYERSLVFEVLVLGLLFGLLLRLGPDGVPEFIYYQF
jgi:D-alanyl-lipoteichoic acid acyltransferase DltB (MBOAT superfamily)